MNWTENLIKDAEISKMRPIRADKYIHKSINKLLTPEFIASGWELQKEYKTLNKVKFEKSLDVQFEDQVWVLLASLGFKIMNRDNQLKIPYDADRPNLTQQIDVFAIDDESSAKIPSLASNVIVNSPVYSNIPISATPP